MFKFYVFTEIWTACALMKVLFKTQFKVLFLSETQFMLRETAIDPSSGRGFALMNYIATRELGVANH